MEIQPKSLPEQANGLALGHNKKFENLDKNLKEYVNFIAASRVSLSFEMEVNETTIRDEKNKLLKELGFSVEMEYEESFTFEGIMQTADRAIQAEFSFEFSFKLEARFNIEAEFERQDPLVLDLDNDGVFTFSSVQDGKLFDINADGRLDRTAFASGGDAFLAFDLNKNGRIDNGTELFGDQNGAENGFQELIKYDDDKNGLIDEKDSIFEFLMAYNQDFLKPLSDFKIRQIKLDYFEQKEDITSQVTLTERSTAKTESAEISVADALVSYKTVA